jgi:hypothetical protein
MLEKQQNTALPSVLRVMQGNREHLITVKFNIFYSGTEVSVAHSKVTAGP